MRIDSSGNVGIGTSSPSALLDVTAGNILAGGKGVEISGNTSYIADGSYGTSLDITHNYQSNDGSFRAINIDLTDSGTNNQSLYGLYVNAENNYLSGNVGIGTTSPDRALHVSTSDNLPVFVESTDGLSLLGIGDSSGSVAVAANGSSFSVYTGGEVGGNTSFGAERMRIDSSGNLLVGKTASSLNTTGIQLQNDGLIRATKSGADVLQLNRQSSDGAITTFYKDGTTVGSIGTISSGDLYIADGRNAGIKLDGGNNQISPVNSSGSALDATLDLGQTGGRFKDLYLSGGIYSGNPTNTAGNLFLHIDGDADGVSTGYKIRSGVGVTTGSSHIAFVNPNGIVGQIRTDGSATSYNTSSDERLKQNIQDADDAGSKIDAIQVRQFDWKIDGTHESYGVIAQELQSVAPEAVSGNPESEEMMGVDYSKLVPTLIKEIQTLRNRVAQLENN